MEPVRRLALSACCFPCIGGYDARGGWVWRRCQSLRRCQCQCRCGWPSAATSLHQNTCTGHGSISEAATYAGQVVTGEAGEHEAHRRGCQGQGPCFRDSDSGICVRVGGGWRTGGGGSFSRGRWASCTFLSGDAVKSGSCTGAIAMIIDAPATTGVLIKPPASTALSLTAAPPAPGGVVSASAAPPAAGRYVRVRSRLTPALSHRFHVVPR